MHNPTACFVKSNSAAQWVILILTNRFGKTTVEMTDTAFVVELAQFPVIARSGGVREAELRACQREAITSAFINLA